MNKGSSPVFGELATRTILPSSAALCEKSRMKKMIIKRLIVNRIKN